MKSLLSGITVLIKKPTLLLFIFFVFFTIDRYNRWVNFKADNFPLVHDVDQFYCYLPAAFIHHDLSFKYPNNYWTVTAPNGNKIARTTYGMAVLYAPFFFAGHQFAKRNDYKEDGYSLPYRWALHIGTLLYALIGLWLLRKVLLRFFSEYVTLLTLLAVFLASNLFYYTFGWGEMSHSYLFFVLSLALYFYFKWDETKVVKYFYVFIATAGFAVLIRPTDIVIMLLPLLYKVDSVNAFKVRIQEFKTMGVTLFWGLLVFMLPWLLQLAYWKIYSGSWFVFTYNPGERFFFNDPQIINFLFSYRKGWLIYTPVMALSLIGILLLFKTNKSFTLFVLIYLLANVYLLSCWWDWSFGGSFGCRAIVQHYAVLAIPLASFFTFIMDSFNKNKLSTYVVKSLALALVLFFVKLNYDMSWKYKYALIHPTGMTKEAFYFSLKTENPTPEQLIEFNKLIREPDYKSMISGNRD